MFVSANEADGVNASLGHAGDYNQAMRALVITALLLGACSKSQNEDAASEIGNKVEQANTPAFGDFSLGSSYTELAKRSLYQHPCDDDPVDKQEKQRVMIYGGKPCRDRSFEQGTSLLLFISNDEADQSKAIASAVWLGGTYFDARNPIGLTIGTKRDAARKTLGEPTSSFVVPGRARLDVEVHTGNRFAIYDGDVAAGFAVGPLPTELRKSEEHWRAVSQIYRKYTARVGGAQVSKEKCQQMAAKMSALMEPHDPALAKRFSSRIGQFLEQCGRELSLDEFDCAMAATTYVELRGCARRNR